MTQVGGHRCFPSIKFLVRKHRTQEIGVSTAIRDFVCVDFVQFSTQACNLLLGLTGQMVDRQAQGFFFHSVAKLA